MLPLLLPLFLSLTAGQLVNQPPQFVPGTGDMSRFSLSENTPVGSPVFQLKGELQPGRFFFFFLILVGGVLAKIACSTSYQHV